VPASIVGARIRNIPLSIVGARISACMSSRQKHPKISLLWFIILKKKKVRSRKGALALDQLQRGQNTTINPGIVDAVWPGCRRRSTHVPPQGMDTAVVDEARRGVGLRRKDERCAGWGEADGEQGAGSAGRDCIGTFI
jgi:hypothetical protein